MHHARTHDTLPVGCCVEKWFFWGGARRPVTRFINSTTTHVSQLARLSSCWKWFFLAASIQSGEHLRQHKAHHRDTQNATNTTLTDEKPQTTSLFNMAPNDVGGTLGAPNRDTHTHTPTWSHLRSTHRLIWDAAAPATAFYRTTSPRTHTCSHFGDRGVHVSPRRGGHPKGICSASRRDAGHVSARSQGTRAQNNT